jgi:hypothetical protein
MQVIHDNQYGVIKSRTIQDCLSWAYEYLHQCHKSKRAMVILKLDLEKAFDKVKHSFIYQVLKNKDFGPKWCKCIMQLLSSATSSILLNGVLGPCFITIEGSDKGIPYPSFSLFQLMIFFSPLSTKLCIRDALSVPLTSSYDFPIIQYVDHTLIIFPTDREIAIYKRGATHIWRGYWPHSELWKTKSDSNQCCK